MKNTKYHQPVMLDEVLVNLHIKKNGKYIDATLGTGGHSLEILKAGGNLLGIEADPEILKIADERFKVACPTSKYKLVLGNFSKIDNISESYGFNHVDGILFDLGVSNLHLKDSLKGFSFDNPDDPLDMRLNSTVQNVTAADLLNALDKTQLTNLFAVTMRFPDAKNLASLVFANKPFEKVRDLLEVTKFVRGKRNLNSATLPMLALRIAVNEELANLEEVLPKSFNLLKRKGRLLIITFHSGEERVLDRFKENKIERMGPGEKEILSNPRSRSAKLHIYEKK